MTPRLISPEYAELNRQLHDDKPNYGAHASDSAESVLKICRLNGFKIVLDYGCGKGTLKPAMAALAPDISILEFDPAIPEKENLPVDPVDFVVALDVMEHIEPDYLDDVLSTIAALRPKAVMLMIANQPAKKTLPDGRNAHLIVEPGSWWLQRLDKYFLTITTREDGDHFLFIGQPK